MISPGGYRVGLVGGSAGEVQGFSTVLRTGGWRDDPDIEPSDWLLWCPHVGVPDQVRHARMQLLGADNRWLAWVIHGERSHGWEALNRGASAVVWHDESIAVLTSVVDDQPTEQVRVPSDLGPASRRSSIDLTREDLALAQLIGSGFTSEQIAEALMYDLRHIGYKRAKLAKQLGCSGARELARWCELLYLGMPVGAVPLTDGLMS